MSVAEGSLLSLFSTSFVVAKRDIPPVDVDARAVWHLELGYEPGDEYAAEPVSVSVFADSDADDEYWDYDEDGLGWCTWCGGEGWAEVDDPLWDECDEFGYGPCAACNGTGERRHQWVF